MAFEEIQAEIASLLIRMNEQPEDIHEMELLLREKLNEYRAFGMPLPQDLADLETLLDQKFADRESTTTAPLPERPLVDDGNKEL